MSDEVILDTPAVEGNEVEGSVPETKSWISMVPKDMAEKYHETLNDFDTFDSFVDSSVTSRKELDTLKSEYEGKTILPGEDAGEDSWNAFWAKAGKPEEAKDYGVEEDDISSIYHRANLTKAQAEILTKELGDFSTKSSDTYQKERKESYNETVRTLKQKYGDNYEPRMRTAQAALQNLGGDHLVATMQKKGLDNDVEMLDFFVKLGGLMQEGHIPAGVGVAPNKKGLAGSYDTMKGLD